MIPPAAVRAGQFQQIHFPTERTYEKEDRYESETPVFLKDAGGGQVEVEGMTEESGFLAKPPDGQVVGRMLVLEGENKEGGEEAEIFSEDKGGAHDRGGDDNIELTWD